MFKSLINDTQLKGKISLATWVREKNSIDQKKP